MALLQDYKVLFEQNTEIKEIFYQGQRIWPSVITPPDPKLEPFYVENISNDTETLNIKQNSVDAPVLTIEYSTDKTTWTPFENSTSTTALTYPLQPGDKLYLRCNTNVWASSLNVYNSITGVSKVGGNIMSLLYGNNFTGNETSFPDATLNAMFSHLFYFGNIVDASCLLLPATTLAYQCYASMFMYCQSLTAVPALPATTLAQSCYREMFRNCRSLTTAPELPATTMIRGCYSSMFRYCPSLTTAPELPATTLAYQCYANMFGNCTSLTTAPELLATTLSDYCYENMFSNCTLVNNIKCLATNMAGSGPTNGWLTNVAASGTFTKAAGVTWPTGTSGIPEGWTVIEV